MSWAKHCNNKSTKTEEEGENKWKTTKKWINKMTMSLLRTATEKIIEGK